jgi:hypothetical protein
MAEPAPPRRSLRSRLRPRGPGDPLARSGYSLMINVILTGGLGVVFWIAAARLFPSATVGTDSALVSAMLVVSTVCQLNFSSTLLRFLPVVKLSPARVVLAAYALTAGASIIGGTAFVLVAPHVARSYRFLTGQPLIGVIYVLAIVAWGVFALQDSVLIALRRAPWVPLENGVFGLLKILALPALLAVGTVHAVFVAWMIPMILLLVPVNWAIFKRVIPARPQPQGRASPIEQFGRRRLAAFVAGDYLATICIQVTGSFMPVAVVALLGPSRGAYFAIPFSIVAAFDLLFMNVTSSMTVEASLDQDRLSALARATVAKFGPFLALGVLVLIAGAGLILLPYGPAYVHGGATVLRLLGAASTFRATVTLYFAICRIEGRAGRILALEAAALVLTAGLTVWLASSRGLTGVGWAWLITNVLIALVALPKLRSVLFRGGARGELAGGVGAA